MQYVGMELLTCGRGTESSRVPPDFYCPLGQLSHERVHKGVGGGSWVWEKASLGVTKSNLHFYDENFNFNCCVLFIMDVWGKLGIWKGSMLVWLNC